MTNDQQNELQPDSGKKRLIEKATGAEFNLSYGETIAKNFVQILQPEVELTRTHPELFTLPHTAKANLPDLDEDTNALMKEKWREFLGRYINPNRFMTPTANANDNFTTWLKFDANLWPFQQGLWKLYTIYLDGNHVPLTIQNNFDKATINPKPELITDEQQEELVLALTENFEGQKTEKEKEESRKLIKRGMKDHQLSETMALNLLINSPHEFVNFFRPENMTVFPSRLMSRQEIDQWFNVVNQVFSLGKRQRVIVGKPGYVAHQEYEALYQFGLETPVLKATCLNNDGVKQKGFGTLFPVPVTDQGSEIAWTICSIYRTPGIPDPAVSFDHHGANEVYYFNRRGQFHKS